jgi:hypothetical protein
MTFHLLDLVEEVFDQFPHLLDLSAKVLLLLQAGIVVVNDLVESFGVLKSLFEHLRHGIIHLLQLKVSVDQTGHLVLIVLGGIFIVARKSVDLVLQRLILLLHDFAVGMCGIMDLAQSVLGCFLVQLTLIGRLLDRRIELLVFLSNN